IRGAQPRDLGARSGSEMWMATKILKEAGPAFSGGPSRLLWGPCEVYVCGDPDCRSKVLVLQPPQQEPRHPTLPRCVCGSILHIGGTSTMVPEWIPPQGWVCDPSEERE